MDPTVTDEETRRFEVEKVGQLIEQQLPRLQSIKEKDVVLVLGATKSGKSTLVNYLLGAQYSLLDDGDGFPTAKWESGAAHAEVGVNDDSTTISPAAYSSPTGVTFCDVPGFDDTRSKAEKMCCIGTTAMGIQMARSVQVLVVALSFNGMKEDSASGLRSTALNLSKLLDFREADRILPRFVFCFTKVDEAKVTKEGLLKKVGKLSDTFKANVCKPNLDSEYRESLQASLVVLDIIRSSENLFLMNIFDQGESRGRLVERCRLFLADASPGIPKERFTMARLSPEWRDFSGEIFRIVGEGKKWLDFRLRLPGEILKKKSDIASYREKIKKSEDNIEALVQKRLSDDQALALVREEAARSKEASEGRIEKIQGELEELRLKLSKIDTDEEVPFPPSICDRLQSPGYWAVAVASGGTALGVTGGIGSMMILASSFMAGAITLPLFAMAYAGVALTSSGVIGGSVLVSGDLDKLVSVEKKITHEGVPFIRVQEVLAGEGTLEFSQFEPSQGKFIAILKRKGQKVEVELLLYVRKRDLPENQIIIKQCLEEAEAFVAKIISEKAFVAEQEDLAKHVDAAASLHAERQQFTACAERLELEVEKMEHTDLIQAEQVVMSKLALWSTIAYIAPHMGNLNSEDLVPAFCLSFEIYKSAYVYNSWRLASVLNSTVNLGGKAFRLVPPSATELETVRLWYEKAPMVGYEIDTVEVVLSLILNTKFEMHLRTLQARSGESKFGPKWDHENEPGWRKSVAREAESMAALVSDHMAPDVKILPLWHGTSVTNLDTIFRTGFANLSDTDPGYFGKGLYGTPEAAYAYRVYAKPHGDNAVLLLNYVSFYSAYPVIDGDMGKLKGKGNLGNYDAHFIPVVPRNPDDPNEVVFLPCKPNQHFKYREVVTFDSGSCLPRYIVTLRKIPVPV